MAWYSRTRTPVREDGGQVDRLTAEIELLKESLSDYAQQITQDDQGWARLGASDRNELSRAELTDAERLCTTMGTVNPLCRRAVALRIAYVWGSGVEVTAAEGEGDGQDVNAVVQAFLDGNAASLWGQSAREELERGLATRGNLFLALFTQPRTGWVTVRSVDFAEITDVFTNPDDADEPWFYVREWTTSAYGDGGVRETQTRKVLYPALGYLPVSRPAKFAGIPVQWDAPMLHVPVNRMDGWAWGVPDLYPAVTWARAYSRFLSDWAALVKSLSKFAWRASTKTAWAAQAARAALAQAVNPITGEETVGGALVGAAAGVEAIPKTGATIDADSGRPLATMVAASTDVPVTALLGDPGITGARATAETLDEPTRLVFSARRELWSNVLRLVLDYVIAQAVRAPAGPLKGKVEPDPYSGIPTVTLTGDVSAAVSIDWPDDEQTPVDVLVKAIADADSTQKLPPETVARLLLVALGVDDVDEVLALMRDEQGRWVGPDGANPGAAAMDALDRGQQMPPTVDPEDPEDEGV